MPVADPTEDDPDRHVPGVEVVPLGWFVQAMQRVRSTGWNDTVWRVNL